MFAAWRGRQGFSSSASSLCAPPQEPPSELDQLFSRGMDPLVEDPSKCHDHPATPARWPDRAQVGGASAGALQVPGPASLLELSSGL